MNLKTLPVVLAIALAFSGAASDTARAELISYWAFDGDFTDSVGVNDAVKYTYTDDDVTDDNDATTGVVDGRTALILDGLADGLITPSNSTLDFGAGDSFTYAFWLKATENGETGNNNFRSSILMRDQQSSPWNGITMISFGPSSSSNYELRGALDGGSPSENVRYAESTVDSPINIFDDTWHHVAWVVNDLGSATGTSTLYIDGIEGYSITDLSSVGNDTAIGDQPLYIGTERENGERWLKGSIDDLAVWNEALSPAAISGIARDLYTPLTVPEPSSLLLFGLALVGSASLIRKK